jgi:hypothetical protein
VLLILCATCVSFFKANYAGTHRMWCTVHWDQCRRYRGKVKSQCCTRWCRLTWCVPFVITAAPSLLLALLLIFTVQEPPRGGETLIALLCGVG